MDEKLKLLRKLLEKAETPEEAADYKKQIADLERQILKEQALKEARAEVKAEVEAKESERDAALADADEKGQALANLKAQLKAGGPFSDDATIKVGAPAEYRGYNLKRAAERFIEEREKKGYNKSVERAKGDAERLSGLMKVGVDLMLDAAASPEEFAARQKDLVGQTTTAGGFLVPDEQRFEILTYARDSSIILRRGNVVSMISDVQTLPRENAKFALDFKSEGTEAGETSPTFEQVTLTAKELTGYAQVSWALEQDAANPGGIVGVLMDQLLEEYGITVDQQGMAGTGDPVSGVFTGPTGVNSVVFSAGSTNFSEVLYTNLLSMVGTIKPRNRRGASWTWNYGVLWTYINSLVDGNSRPLIMPGNAAMGAPATLLGYPLDESESAPSTNEAGKPMGLFGNWQGFMVGERLNTLMLFRDPYSLSTKRLTNYVAFTRVAFATALPDLFVRLVTAAE